MVEGPGCTLNGEKIRSKVKTGQTVNSVSGSATKQKKDGPGPNPLHRLRGCAFTGVQTLGKELFMYFGPRALRVHFGMNGSLRINPFQGRAGSTPVLEIHLGSDKVVFYDSTVEMRLTQDCEQKVSAAQCLDVCSSRFSLSRSEEAVRSQTGRMLCDVLLDQAVMPGVGNIIKNEALFDSGLHPAVKVEQLADEQIHHLVKMTRDFTLLFYKCRKSGSALHKHYKVYKRPQCGQCSSAITVCRLGDNGRMTYFCERCQRANPSGVDISRLPVRNSLIGWAPNERSGDTVARKEEEDWACQLCTLINQPGASACDACLTPRPPAGRVDGADTEASPFASDLIKCPCIAFRKPQEELKVNWRSAFGTTTLVFSDTGRKPNPQSPPLLLANNHLKSPATGGGFYKNSVCQGTSRPNYASGGALSDGKSPASCGHAAKKMRIDHSAVPCYDPGTGAAPPPRSGAGEVPLQSPSTPCCPTHGRPAVLRVVHKPGQNKGRHFYSCSLSRDSGCGFFEWADLHFPTCHHSKRCVMRTVLKLGPNNGRSFYACSAPKGKQCDFFQWTPPGTAAPTPRGC